jgi:predicted ATPase
MLIKRLQASGLLSFGPGGIDLPLGDLNVLIGPNGSGKSNLIEMLALLQATPRDLQAPLAASRTAAEWLWKGEPKATEGTLEVEVTNPGRQRDLRHVLALGLSETGLEVRDERVETDQPYEGQPGAFVYYNFRRGRPLIKEVRGPQEAAGEEEESGRDATRITPRQSVLAQRKDADRFPALARLQDGYSGMRVYRNWVFGPVSPLRRPEVSAGPEDVVAEDFSNYQRVIWRLRRDMPGRLLECLAALYQGVEDFHLDPKGDTVLLSLREKGVGYLPLTRLSDGTLRYLCLLAILLAPAPPPLLVIDEPDLGLHPDLMPTLASLLTAAAARSQLIVTTHSRALVDSFTDQPGAVITCGKDETGTCFERLDPEALEDWLKKYTLGQLWSRGDIGGNRW